MKCLSAVALFCLIAIVSAGIRSDHPLRLKRQIQNGVQSFSSSSSSSSSSTQQGGGPIVFQQQSSSYNAVGPLNNAGAAGAVPNLLQDRFGPEDNTGNNQATQAISGHVSSVSGTYDPNTQQIIFFQNYHTQV